MSYVELTLHELYILIDMLHARIKDADRAGIGLQHSSRILRENLLHKLINAYKELSDATDNPRL